MKPGPAISALAMPSFVGQLLGQPRRRGRAAARPPSWPCAARRWSRSRRARGCAAARRRRRRGAPRRPGLVAPARRGGGADEVGEQGGGHRSSLVRRPQTLAGSSRAHAITPAASAATAHGGAAQWFLRSRTYTACMASGKNSRAVRSARAAVVAKRSTPWGMIAAVLVVVLFAGAIFGYYVVQNNAKQAKAAALAEWTPSDTNKDPSAKIPGIVIQPYAGANHVQPNQTVAYTHSPPFGGTHDGYWAACNGVVYPTAGAQREHGARAGARLGVDRLQPRQDHRRRAEDAERQDRRAAVQPDVALPRPRPADLAAVVGPPAEALRPERPADRPVHPVAAQQPVPVPRAGGELRRARAGRSSTRTTRRRSSPRRPSAPSTTPR